MKRKILALTMSVVLVLGLNIAALGADGTPPNPEPISPPICLDCECLDCCM